MPKGIYKRVKKGAKKARRTKANRASSVAAESSTQAWSIDREAVPVELDPKDQEIYNLRREVGDLNARLSQRNGGIEAQRNALLYTIESLTEAASNLVRAIRSV